MSWMETLNSHHKLGKSGWTLIILHREWLTLEMLILMLILILWKRWTSEIFITEITGPSLTIHS